MKKIVLALLVLTSICAGAQTVTEKAPSQINVSGEGQIMAVPDEAVITIGVTNNGTDAAEVKKANDIVIDKVIKYLRSIKMPEKDYQTQRVYLNRSQDYKTKKYSFTASQTMTIYLRDLSKYDALLMELTDAGINTIQGVEFKTSKQKQYESEARIKAVADAKMKAEDYVKATDMYLGYPLLISDNTQTNYPRPAMYAMEMKSMAADASQETLAVGEIAITANVSITYEISYLDIKKQVDKYRDMQKD
ncbi:SIMPL domain-containing protein [Flavobacterium salilacus subsp. salilacus]|uniref:SIMPL domain-containing protein n=1 Tax=Flavobacterium TaxID=237 RepID=UPI001074F161|nr:MULTISPECIES: SIMPL domain-containing protein [Flavobacterium]KAF2519173.1 SIMPL domain-containing protein [Flavobacterium salilacus subsp. salilacus]MBE1613353.1 SIMPL domain-containing protein [Flavobacterium sp. SaA2.13]